MMLVLLFHDTLSRGQDQKNEGARDLKGSDDEVQGKELVLERQSKFRVRDFLPSGGGSILHLRKRDISIE